MITNKIRIALDKPESRCVIPIKKNSINSRTISITLYNGGSVVELDNVKIATIKGIKPDNTKIYNDCIINNNEILYDITSQTISVSGTVSCELKLFGYNNEALSSSSFEIEVYDEVFPDDVLESVDEFNILNALLGNKELAKRTIEHMDNDYIHMNEDIHDIIDDLNNINDIQTDYYENGYWHNVSIKDGKLQSYYALNDNCGKIFGSIIIRECSGGTYDITIPGSKDSYIAKFVIENQKKVYTNLEEYSYGNNSILTLNENEGAKILFTCPRTSIGDLSCYRRDYKKIDFSALNFDNFSNRLYAKSINDYFSYTINRLSGLVIPQDSMSYERHDNAYYGKPVKIDNNNLYNIPLINDNRYSCFRIISYPGCSYEVNTYIAKTDADTMVCNSYSGKLNSDGTINIYGTSAHGKGNDSRYYPESEQLYFTDGNASSICKILYIPCLTSHINELKIRLLNLQYDELNDPNRYDVKNYINKMILLTDRVWKNSFAVDYLKAIDSSMAERISNIEEEVPNLATKTYVEDQIVASEHLKREIITSLPTDEEAKDNVIYMLKVESVTGNDKYQEYMKINGSLQLIGDTSVDLTDYAKTSDIPTTVAELSDASDYAKTDDVNKELQGLKGDIATEKSERKAEINVERKRIDNIIALPEGSTTGDAELQDIRVMIDGTISDTAGNAVRTQINELKSDLDDISIRQDSINLFDNIFDESGFINPSTGVPTDASDYKRTSKFYPIDATNNTMLNLLVSNNVSTFVILFYGENKNYIEYYGLGAGVVRQIPLINKNYRYFKVYTDATYNEECCISYEWTDYVIVPYGKTRRLKPITVDILDRTMFCNDNIINSILNNKYLIYNTGDVVDNTDYRTSDYLEVESNTDYIHAFYNNGGSVMYSFNAVGGAFYDENNNYISGFWHYTSTYTNCSFYNGFTKVTSPSNAKYVKLTVNDNANNVNWYFAKATNNICVSYNRLNKDLLPNNKKLVGKTIVNFGDSIFGNTLDETSTSNLIGIATGANVINCGFGGCKMSVHSGNWNLCSMHKLADDIYNESFDELVSAVQTGWSGMPGYFTNTAYYLSHIDFSEVDVITISYGTNDYRDGATLDNKDNRFDTSTVCGALRYAIKQIQTKYPHIMILVTSPIYRYFADISESSDTKSWGGGTLLEFAEAYKNVCKEMKVNFLDLQYESEFNEYTRSYFYPSDDGTHPNEKGRERIATLIGRKLESLI